MLILSLMNDLLKNKVVLIVAGVIVLLVIVGGLFLFSSKKPAVNPDAQSVNALPTQVPIPTITADSIGLTLKAGLGGKTVIVAVSDISGISAIDYELSYTSKGNIPRGAIGQFDLTKKPVSKEITLGTCSDVCHYDQDVTNIKIILKVTKDDGKVYQAESSLSSVSQ